MFCFLSHEYFMLQRNTKVWKQVFRGFKTFTKQRKNIKRTALQNWATPIGQYPRPIPLVKIGSVNVKPDAAHMWVKFSLVWICLCVRTSSSHTDLHWGSFSTLQIGSTVNNWLWYCILTGAHNAARTGGGGGWGAQWEQDRKTTTEKHH